MIRVLFSVLFSLYHQRTINPLNSARPGHVRKTTEGGGRGKKGAITLPHYHLMDAVFCSPSGAIDNHRDTRPYLRARPFSYFFMFLFFPLHTLTSGDRYLKTLVNCKIAFVILSTYVNLCFISSNA